MRSGHDGAWTLVVAPEHSRVGASVVARWAVVGGWGLRQRVAMGVAVDRGKMCLGQRSNGGGGSVGRRSRHGEVRGWRRRRLLEHDLWRRGPCWAWDPKRVNGQVCARGWMN